ncbi:MAG TPA: hypothetical protein VMZ30_13430, partial [Pyrinomonadaceae bacterium]|nr:hypothetical protein [Pyrinomonadaceae bacterium]
IFVGRNGWQRRQQGNRNNRLRQHGGSSVKFSHALEIVRVKTTRALLDVSMTSMVRSSRVYV